MPLTLQAEPLSVATSASPGTRVTLRGAVDIRAIEERHHLSGLQYLSGAADWTFIIDVPLQQDGRLPPRRVEVVSELKGISIALPAPLGKPAAEARTFRLVGELSDRPVKRFDIRYGSEIDTALVMARDAGGEMVLQRCQVRFGGAEADPDAPGLQVVGSMELLDLDPWLNWLDPDQASNVELPLGDLLRGVDLKIRDLHLAGRRYEQVELALSRSEMPGAAWEGKLRTSRMAASLHLPADREREPLVLEFSHLDLEPGGDGEAPAGEEAVSAARPTRDPRSFPALHLDIEDLRINGHTFGRLELRTSKSADGIVIDRLSFRGPELELDAGGSWLADEEGAKSRLDLTANSADPGRLIRRFGLDTNIEARSADLRSNLEWRGGPLEVGLRDLQGDFDIHIVQGRFLDVDPGLGRVFGLLSLSALQRRLTLDFTDTFGKGFAFDRIEGSFLLDDGNAYTTDSYLEGPSARLDIAGRTGLVSRDYDQYVTVTPRVSTSIPLAAALAVSPPIGAAVLVAQQLVGKELDKISRYRYEVRGPWEAPEITLVRLRAEASQNAGFLDGEFQ